VVNFKHFGTTVTNQNYIHEEIKRRLKLGNAWYNSVLSLSSSPLLSEILKTKWTNLQFICFLHGCESWSPTLREHSLRYTRTGCWWKGLDPQGRKWQENGEDCIMKSFITCRLHEVLLVWTSQEGGDGCGI